MFFKYAVAALAAAAPLASAQTSSKCNPMKQDNCPNNPGSTKDKLSFDFTKDSGLDQWNTTAGKIKTSSDGAEFKISEKGDAPTIQSEFYIHYGEISVEMKAAPGTGIVSSIVLQSDDLDEIDWEALGGDTTSVQTNYFGKGDTDSYDRDTWPKVDKPQDDFHTYTVNWQEDKTTWSIDDKVVRTLNYKDAKDGSRYPQTPVNIRIGIWAGGAAPSQGTVEWAGGATDFSQAPFSMYIKSVEIKNQNPSKSYSYGDKTGSSDSIKYSDSSASSDSSSASSSSATSSSDSSASGSSTMATATSSASGSGSSSGASETGSSGSGSGSGSGSSSGSGSGASGSASGSSSSASATASYNAAPNVAATFGPMSLLALVSAFIQL